MGHMIKSFEELRLPVGQRKGISNVTYVWIQLHLQEYIQLKKTNSLNSFYRTTLFAKPKPLYCTLKSTRDTMQSWAVGTRDNCCDNLTPFWGKQIITCHITTKDYMSQLHFDSEERLFSYLTCHRSIKRFQSCRNIKKLSRTRCSSSYRCRPA